MKRKNKTSLIVFEYCPIQGLKSFDFKKPIARDVNPFKRKSRNGRTK